MLDKTGYQPKAVLDKIIISANREVDDCKFFNHFSGEMLCLWAGAHLAPQVVQE